MPELNVEESGNPNGAALLMVHGFLSSNAQWLPNVDTLGERFRLIMVELWGHGASPLPADHEISLEAYDAAFEAVRDRLRINKWGVVGQSYAAGLMLRYALNHPERTTGVVVTNSRSAFGDITQNQRPPPASRSTQDGSETAADRSRNRHLPIHPVYARRLPDEIKTKLVEAADRISAEAISAGGQIGTALNCMDFLHRVPRPVMLVNGAYEKSFQPEADRIRRDYSNVQVVDLEGGHAVNIEASAPFNESVISFFEQLQDPDDE